VQANRGESISTSGITRKNPPPTAVGPEGPYQRIIRLARENYPDSVQVPMTRAQWSKCKKTFANQGLVADVTYRQGILTVAYITERKQR
jgi:hypothetical protein